MSKITKALNAQKAILAESKVKKSLMTEAKSPYDKGGFSTSDQGMSGCPTLWNTEFDSCIVYSEPDKSYQVNWGIEGSDEPNFEDFESGEAAFKFAKSKGIKFKSDGLNSFIAYLKDELKVTK